MPSRVLSVSYERTLLETRAMILRQHGFAVSSVDNLSDALSICGKESFDAAVIGHSIGVAERRQISATVRETSPGVFVVALRSNFGDNVSFADTAVDAFRPEELVAALDDNLRETKSSRTHG